MTWKGEKQRHMLAAKGVKEYVEKRKEESNKEQKRLYDKYMKIILNWKNENAKKLALYYMKNPLGPINMVDNKLTFGWLDEKIVNDNYGNKWQRIIISDKPYNYLETTKLVSIPIITKRNRFKFLKDIKNVQYEINKNPFEIKHDKIFTWNKQSIPRITMLIVYPGTIILESELIIRIEGNSEKEINKVNKTIDNKLRNIFYIKREQIRYD